MWILMLLLNNGHVSIPQQTPLALRECRELAAPYNQPLTCPDNADCAKLVEHAFCVRVDSK